MTKREVTILRRRLRQQGYIDGYEGREPASGHGAYRGAWQRGREARQSDEREQRGGAA